MDFKNILTTFNDMEKDSNESPRMLTETDKKTPNPSAPNADAVKRRKKIEQHQEELRRKKEEDLDESVGIVKGTLSNVFEELSLEPAKPGAQHITQDGETIGTVSDPNTANQIKQAIDKGTLTMGDGELNEEELDEKWAGDTKIKSTGKWADKTIAELQKARSALKSKEDRTEEETSKLRQINFAIRSKKDWKGKVAETDSPPESSMDLTSPLSGDNRDMAEGVMPTNPSDDGDHNTVDARDGNDASNASLATDATRDGEVDEGMEFIQLPLKTDPEHIAKMKKEKEQKERDAAMGQDFDYGHTGDFEESKSRKLPSISKVKSMCSEGMSTSQIKQLHPKCNKKELNTMIKNTKTNLKEGAEHILKAAKHMGHAHGLCKGSYACPHDEGSEGANAYHEGYKHGLDEACGMKNAYEDAPDGMGIRQEPILGMVREEPEAEVVDTMASYGAMDEAEFDEGNEFSGAMAKVSKGDKFSVGGNTYTKTVAEEEHDAGIDDKYDWNASTEGDKEATYEDAWTFESLEAELESVLNEGQPVEEGVNISVQSGMGDAEDRVSVNATDAEADKLLKFVKDVGLGQYGDPEMEVVTPDVADVSFYGSEAPSEEPLGSHDDMLKLMGIVDMEDNAEAPGTTDYEDEESSDSVDVQVIDGDSEEEMCEACGSKMTTEGCGCSKTDEGQGYNDKEDESLGMRDGKDSHKDDDYAGRRDQSRGDFGHRHGGEVHEEQGYNDREDEQLGMRDGKDSSKDDDDASRRDQSRGDFGHRHGGHLEEEDDYGMYNNSEHHKRKESDAEMDDHAERAGKEVAHDAKYDDRKHSGKDGEDVTKDLEYDDYKDHHRADEEKNPDGHHHTSNEPFIDPDGPHDEEDEDKKEHKHSLEDNLAKLDEIVKEYSDDNDIKPQSDDMHEESDVERDDRAEKAGREVAHDAKYDGRDHPGKDGKKVAKDIEYDEMHEEQGYNDREHESLGMRTGKESGKKQSMKDREDDSYGKEGKRDKEDRHISLEENLRTLDLLAEVGVEASEQPTQSITEPDDSKLLTAEGAEDAQADDLDGSVEPVTETQTDDQREFAVAEDDEKPDFADIDKDGDKKESMKKASKDKEEKLDEWANDAGKNGTDTSFEQDINFMTKVISGGLNKQKSTGQTTIPVIAGQNDRMGYNGADVVKEGSVMSHDGLANLMSKMDELSK